jgi:hypothetical protein
MVRETLRIPSVAVWLALNVPFSLTLLLLHTRLRSLVSSTLLLARSLTRCLLRCTPSLALHSYSGASAKLCFLRGTCNDVVHGCCSPALRLCQTQCPGLQSEAAPPAAAMSNSRVCFRLFAAALGFAIACFHFFFLSYFLHF